MEDEEGCTSEEEGDEQADLGLVWVERHLSASTEEKEQKDYTLTINQLRSVRISLPLRVS